MGDLARVPDVLSLREGLVRVERCDPASPVPTAQAVRAGCCSRDVGSRDPGHVTPVTHVTSVRYLLDTNICIYIAKHRPAEVAARFERLSPGQVGMSLVT